MLAKIKKYEIINFIEWRVVAKLLLIEYRLPSTDIKMLGITYTKNESLMKYLKLFWLLSSYKAM